MSTWLHTKLAGVLVVMCVCAACTTSPSQSTFEAVEAVDASWVGVDVKESGIGCPLIMLCSTKDTTILPNNVCPAGYECYTDSLGAGCGDPVLCGCPAREGGSPDAHPCTRPQDAEPY